MPMESTAQVCIEINYCRYIVCVRVCLYVNLFLCGYNLTIIAPTDTLCFSDGNALCTAVTDKLFLLISKN